MKSVSIFAAAACLAFSTAANAQHDHEEHEQHLDSSVDIFVAGGTSTEDDEGIESLQGGGHDPRRRGFTLQQVELSLSGEIDPYFKGESHVIFIEDDVELEEAFIKSVALPRSVELKAGYYLAEFGRLNATHPHAWPWIDQAVVNSRFLGSDGTRAPGARLAWTPPFPWFSKIYAGAQNADDKTAASFLGEAAHHHGDEEGEHDHESEEGVGGLPRVRDESDELLYSIRLENSADFPGVVSALLGFSGMFGPNTSGEDAQTALYGADLTVEWKPENDPRGFPYVTWQTEIMKRDYETDETADDEDVFGGENLEDWGLYSQILWGFRPQWDAGVRVDYASGDGEGREPREEDSLRDDRLRVSPLVQYHPSESSRVRLQYNYDDADHLEDGEAHTVWVGVEMQFGHHPSHQ